MIIGLLFMSFILFWGGGPHHDRLGFRYWKNPGAANTYLEEGNAGRFIALLSTLVLSAVCAYSQFKTLCFPVIF